MLFQMLAVFSEFERAIITSRINAGLDRARSKGIRLGRPPTPPIRLERVERALETGKSIRAIARSTGVSTATVMRVKRSMNDQTGDRLVTVEAA